MNLIPDIFNRYFPDYSYSTSYFLDKDAVKYEDGQMTMTFELPGLDKKDIDLSYHPDRQLFHIFVKDRLSKNLYLTRAIDDNNIEAELSLGVLKVRAPILNRSKSIQIK